MTVEYLRFCVTESVLRGCSPLSLLREYVPHFERNLCGVLTALAREAFAFTDNIRRKPGDPVIEVRLDPRFNVPFQLRKLATTEFARQFNRRGLNTGFLVGCQDIDDPAQLERLLQYLDPTVMHPEAFNRSTVALGVWTEIIQHVLQMCMPVAVPNTFTTIQHAPGEMQSLPCLVWLQGATRTN